MAFRLKPEATHSLIEDLRGFRLQAEGCVSCGNDRGS